MPEGNTIFRRVRGILTAALLGLILLIMDLIQRTLLVGMIKVRPSSRERVLTRWKRLLGEIVVWNIQRFGGAALDLRPRIRSRPGVLILSNHQSLLDIPLIIHCVEDGYALFVTRERYSRGFPLISKIIRLYGHPTVRPGERIAGQLERLKTAAVEAGGPIVIFPEGSRTRDGEIGRFRTAGLRVILGARKWSVYVVVLDGFWKSAHVSGFIRNVASMRGVVDSVGPFEFDPKHDSMNGFIADMDRRMRDKLQEMQGARGSS